MPKYQSRFANFFLNLRLNRAEFGDMAAFTLQALQQHAPAARYAPLVADLEAALTAYRSTHAGQLSGEARGTTLTVAQALNDFRAYLKRVERQHVTPTYDEGSADLKAIFPTGRSGLSKSNQAVVLDRFTAFLQALDQRPDAFPVKVRDEGRTAHAALAQALARAAGHEASADTLRDDLHDGREATARQLFRAYATLLLEHYEQPQRVAAYFDLSKAFMGGKKNKPAKLPKTGA
jgi:hypothetical protein